MESRGLNCLSMGSGYKLAELGLGEVYVDVG